MNYDGFGYMIKLTQLLITTQSCADYNINEKERLKVLVTAVIETRDARLNPGHGERSKPPRREASDLGSNLSEGATF